MRPLRITRKRIVVSSMVLEEFLAEFSEHLVDAIETIFEYAYEKKVEEDPKWESDGEYDESDDVGNALMDVEMALETMRDLVSAHRQVPTGSRHAPQVLVGKRAGTITIVRGSAPDLVEHNAAREEAAELLENAEPAEFIELPPHEPYFPDDDDLEPVLVELLDEYHAVN